MPALIPALSTCVSRMTAGERRLAERLQDKLDADYLVWYDVPVGANRAHPDFVVLHPRRGILVLEVKDWRLETVLQADKQTWTLHTDAGPKTVPSPLEQARHYAHAVADALQRDAQLVTADKRLCMPWSYGVVFTRITRRQFTAAQLQHAIEPQRVMCSDEMTEGVDAEELQSRLWGMFPLLMRGSLSLPQIDRVRWILFPEVRVNPQPGLFDEAGDEPAPQLMRVMDLQQEQLARSLGDGHRVIHGVAGSGKTMILGWRAEQLARAASPERPVLVLCFNTALAARLEATIGARAAASGVADRVQVHAFHRWCHRQLRAFGQALPPDGDGFFDALVERVIRGVERRQIPSGQYRAVLVDEAHDFRPEWLKLVVQMVDPASNSLLVMYDDAQSIYERRRTRQFSFKSVGIQAQGRTTVLAINYRNPRQVLETARLVAADLLKSDAATGDDDDGVPRLEPLSCGREGRAPLVIELPTLHDEARRLAELLAAAHEEGLPWRDMAVLCRRWALMDLCAAALRRRGLPHRVSRGRQRFDAGADDAIAVMTMHASKGLEFALVALPGIGQMPEAGEKPEDEARLFYVAATRATDRLIVTLSAGRDGRRGAFAQRLLGS